MRRVTPSGVVRSMLAAQCTCRAAARGPPGVWRETPLVLKDRGNSLPRPSLGPEPAGDLVIEPPLTPPGPQPQLPPALAAAQPVIQAEPVPDPGAFHALIASVQA